MLFGIGIALGIGIVTHPGRNINAASMMIANATRNALSIDLEVAAIDFNDLSLYQRLGKDSPSAAQDA